MQPSPRRSIALTLILFLVAPTLGLVLAPAATAQGEDVRVVAVYADFGLVPGDLAFSSAGFTPGYRFTAIPAIILLGSASSVEGLRADANLREIVYDEPIQFLIETAVVATRAVDVWGTEWHAASNIEPMTKDGVPIDGRGVVVGIVDSGVNALHPDLWYAPLAVDGVTPGPKVIECVHTTGIVGPAITLPTPNCDENVGHGTHVAGIVAGTGMMADMGYTVSGRADYNGAAPGAQLAVAGLGVETVALGGLVIDGLAGLDWQYANADLFGTRVVTNSWSSATSCTTGWNQDSNAMHAIVNKLVLDKGITVLWAANNNGGDKAIGTSPQARQTLPGVINVANYDDGGIGTRNGKIALSSGDGCVVSGGSATDQVWTFPDVAAPGTNIVSTAAGIDGAIGMAPIFVGSTPMDAPFYTTLSGTSMATPLVAGVVALMYQAYPEITPAQVERILIETATPWTDNIASRGVTGTAPYWGPSTVNNAVAGFADKTQCRITPQIAARAEANDPTLDALYPGFREFVQPRLVNGALVDADASLYVCRDFKRGNGLVDAHAAVLRALALAGDGDEEEGIPVLTIDTPVADEVVTDAQVEIAGLVDRLGGRANQAPLATLAASPSSGPAPLDVGFSLQATDADGVIASYTLDFGDGSAPLGGAVLPSGVVSHAYGADGSYTATLTVVDDDGASATATANVRVGGLPATNPDVTASITAYDLGLLATTNAAAVATGLVGDDVPKYVPGQQLTIEARFGESLDPNFPVDGGSVVDRIIFHPDGSVAVPPVPATSYADSRGTGFDSGEFVVPADWSGRYYIGFRLHYGGQVAFFTDATHGGLKAIDVVTPASLVGGSGGSDEGHTIGDSDGDGATPFGEIQWVDLALDATKARAVIKVGAVPPLSDDGTSPFSPHIYAVNIGGVQFQSYLYGFFAPRVWNANSAAQVPDAVTTWDTTTNLVTIEIPLTVLADAGVTCPCPVHVEAQVGQPFLGANVRVDRAPDAGASTLAAEWQRLVPDAIALGSSSEPENTDPEGDVWLAVGTVPPHVDVTKVWVSRETASELDVTLEVADLASAPPSVDAGNPARASWNYGVDLCVDNAAATYTATSGNFAGVAGVVCYRLSAANGVLGVTHSAGGIQKDGSGSCGVPSLSKKVVFNNAASTVTWTLDLTLMTVRTISAGVADCSTAPQARDAPAPTTGHSLSRFAGRTGFSGPVVTAIVDDSDASASRSYTLGGDTPALVALPGAGYTGRVGDAIAIAGTASGGTPPYACAWSASGASFGDASSCATSVQFSTPGAKTLTLAVTDGAGATAVANAPVDVTSALAERVEVLVGGVVTTSAPVSTSSGSPTASWSVLADLSGLPDGTTQIDATWYDADGTTVLATASRAFTLDRAAAVAFVEILSPDAESTVSGQSAVSGSAGRRSEAPAPEGGLQSANHYGFPPLSGLNGGRAATSLEGVVLTPCPACQPGRLQKPLAQIPAAVWNPISNQVLAELDDNLATSAAWLAGPDSDAQGLDGYWFDVAGHGGDDFELTDAFDVVMDIRFFAYWTDAQSLQLGAVNGPGMPKEGRIPETANWAFVYVRRLEDPAAATEHVWGEPVLTITPVVVPPGAVQGLAATSGPGTVALSWSAPIADGGELLGYKILRDGQLLATQPTAGYVDAPGDLAPHMYAVIAYNSAGEGASVAVSASAGAAATTVAITHPLDGAIGVPATTAINGTYTAQGGNAGGAFANTHYVALFNLNDARCGDPLGYGDHVIFERLATHAVEVLGMPAANVHVFNERGIALQSSVDGTHYPQLSAAWQRGDAFDGPARWSVFEPALRSIAAQAAASEAAGGAPARIFFVESSHGLMAPFIIGDGMTDSLFCLVDQDVTSTMLGDLLNGIDAAVADAHENVTIEWSINVDCSFCGGFADSPLPAPSTSAAFSAGVVGPNRVVEVGCAWVTECFGNPAVTYDFMFNRCVFTGDADGYGPLVVTGEGGTDGSDVGNEIIIGNPAHAPRDGVITLEESYWCAIEKSHAPPINVIALQQMFQLSDNLPADMFGLDGFVLWELDSSLDLGQQTPSAPLDLSELDLADVRAVDPADDAITAYGDLVSIEASATATSVLATVGVADLSLSALQAEDVVEYRLDVNGQAFGACYSALFGDYLLWNYGASAESGGSAVYDTANGLVHFTIPIAELSDATLPASVFATSHYGECSSAMVAEDDRAPDTGAVVTSESDDPVITPSADRVSVELTGPATVGGIALLDAANGTWSFRPTSPLASGTWTATATYLRDDGAGYVARGAPASVTFSVGIPSDVTPPTAPGAPVVVATTTSTISLSWTASTDNVGVARYEIVRDGSVVGETAGTSFADAGLAAGTAYVYRVKAYDAAGNHATGPSTTATTDETVSPVGTVTLRVGTTLLGSTDVDLAQGDSAAWSILVDWSLLPDGPVTLVADYDDGQGATASDSIPLVVTRGIEVSITSPQPGEEVLPTFTLTGTVEGAGGPDGYDTSSYMLSDGKVDARHLGFALAQTGGLQAADAALRDAPGYLGVAPALSGAPVIEAYFSGSAPTAPEGVLPAGWTLTMVEDVRFERAIQTLDGPLPIVRAREGPPVPSQASGIGPGSHLFQQRPDGLFGCTANFVWKDTRGEYYLGAAGHCFLPSGKKSTHGPDADYDPRLTSVRVCVSGCTNGGQTGFIVTGTTVPLGPVVYARQITGTAQVGHDFGLVKIPKSLYDQVRPEMPVWNGPTTEGTLSIGEPAVLYGNAAGFGEVWPTMARAGFGGVFGSANSWSAVLPSAPGDSGSALLSGVVTGPENAVEGVEAIGILTHLSGAGPVVGTSMARAKAMALEAGLTIAPVMQGGVIAPPEPTLPSAPVLETLSPGRTSMNLTWIVPENDGNTPITGYVIRYTTGTTTQTKSVGAVTSASVTGLSPATAYRFNVSAVNSVGAGPASNDLQATTQPLPTVPDAPRNLGGVAGNGYVTLGWDAPASDGGSPLTGYTVSFTGPKSGSVQKLPSERTATITGLRNGETYTFSVVAENEAGMSAPSDPLALAPNGPPPPSYTVEVRVVAGETEIVPWRAVDTFDGSSFAVELRDLPGGAATLTARVLEDGREVRATSADVHVLSPPELSLPASVAGNETQIVEFTATATDVDRPDGLVFSLVGGPNGSAIDPQTGRFSWAPQYGDAGTHAVTIRVTDPEGLSDEDSTQLVIGAANRPPVLLRIGNKAVNEGQTLSFVVSATDHENDTLTFSASGLPSGAAFDAVAARFTWTPGFTQKGNHEATFHVTDGQHVVSERIAISVGDVPLPPELSPIPPRSGLENVLMTFRLEATDEEENVLVFSAVGLPVGATLDPATGVFAWTPTFAQAGEYPITFRVTDGTFTVSEETTITILNVDRAPLLQPIPAKSILQLATLSIPLVASDPDGDAITWSVQGPAGVSVRDDGAGLATLLFTPTLEQLGAYNVTVTASANGLDAARATKLTVLFKAGAAMASLTGSSLSASPQEVVNVSAVLHNTGPNTDSFRIQVTNNGGLAIGDHPLLVTLAPGESTTITVGVTANRAKPLTFTTIAATSVGDGATTVSTRTRILVPVFVEVTMAPALAPQAELPAGRVVVRYQNGDLVEGALVAVSQVPDRFGQAFSSMVTGATDASGQFAFDMTRDSRAMLPGTHQLYVAARLSGGLDALDARTYRILL